MTYYNKIKKLDEESLQQIKEGSGPSDKCICSLLAPPEDEKSKLGAMGASIKKVFAAIGGGKKNKGGTNVRGMTGGKNIKGMTSVDIPLTFTKGGNGIYTTKEVVKRGSSCGKCGCGKENFVLKHSFANIRITSPDVNTICPCPTDCLPDKAKMQNNIQVTVEQVQLSQERVQNTPENVLTYTEYVQTDAGASLDPDSVDSEFNILDSFPQRLISSEPKMEKRSISDLINDQYDDENYSDWSYDDD